MDWFPYDRDLRHESVDKATKMTGNEAGNNGFVDFGNLCLLFVLTSNVQYINISISDAYSETCQNPERFVIIINGFLVIYSFRKPSVLDVQRGSEDSSGVTQNCPTKKLFPKISPNSHQKTDPAFSGSLASLSKRVGTSPFLNFAKLSGTAYKEHL